ncbi:MAG: DUF4058 family protein [Isosphaeraceae bacterium]
MPLRDHFRPSLGRRSSWEAVHGGWPMLIVLKLLPSLPPGFVAEPRFHLGSAIEIDVATLDADEQPNDLPDPSDGGIATATAAYVPPLPTLSVETDLPDADVYEVRVYKQAGDRRLVAAIELVSPANKDRPQHRRAFVAKCAALLQRRVSVTVVDPITIRSANLYRDLLELVGVPTPETRPPTLYAVSCRVAERNDRWQLEAWESPLEIGQPLPTLPLWLADDRAIPLDLEASYQDTCRALRIP